MTPPRRPCQLPRRPRASRPSQEDPACACPAPRQRGTRCVSWFGVVREGCGKVSWSAFAGCLRSIARVGKSHRSKRNPCRKTFQISAFARPAPKPFVSVRSRDPSVSLERARGSANRLHLVVRVCLDNRVSAMITPKSRRARHDHPSDVVRVSRIGRDKKTSRSSFGFSQCLVPNPYRNRTRVACTHLDLTDCVLRADLGSGKRMERWKGQEKGFAREKAEARRRLRRGSRHPMSRDGRREKK